MQIPTDEKDRFTKPVNLSKSQLFIALIAVLITAFAGLVFGPADLGMKAVIQELLDRLPLIHFDSGLSSRQQAILFEIRLPRVVLGLLVGSMLATAGGAYQGVFRNPLADPYLLGVAAGAGFGATLAIVLDIGDGLGCLLYTSPSPRDRG